MKLQHALTAAILALSLSTANRAPGGNPPTASALPAHASRVVRSAGWLDVLYKDVAPLAHRLNAPGGARLVRFASLARGVR